MDEYIKRETAVRAVMAAKWVDGSDGAIAMEIVASPTAADVAPVVHGYWDNSGQCKFLDGHIAIRCSICGASITEKEYKNFVWNFCPVCGAKMDGDNTI